MEGDFLCQSLLHIRKQCLRLDGICRARERQPDHPAARRREQRRGVLPQAAVRGHGALRRAGNDAHSLPPVHRHHGIRSSDIYKHPPFAKQMGDTNLYL